MASPSAVGISPTPRGRLQGALSIGLGCPAPCPLFPAVPRTKDGPFALRALCCRPGHHYYGPSQTPDGPAVGLRLLGSADGTRSRGKPPGLSSCGTIPVSHSMPCTPEVGDGSSGRSSPPPAAFAQSDGAQIPRLASRRGRLHLMLRTGCLSRTPSRARCGPFQGFLSVPRRPPPSSQAASRQWALAPRWTARMPGPARILACRVRFRTPTPRFDGVVTDLRRRGDLAAPTLPPPGSHRPDRVTLPGRTLDFAVRPTPCPLPSARGPWPLSPEHWVATAAELRVPGVRDAPARPFVATLHP